MNRRDSLEHDTAREDHEMQMVENIGVGEERYLRLRCLELAVRMHHPDDIVEPSMAAEVANALLRYIRTGTMATQAGAGIPETT